MKYFIVMTKKIIGDSAKKRKKPIDRRKSSRIHEGFLPQ
jgi:hypothetical protein